MLRAIALRNESFRSLGRQRVVRGGVQSPHKQVLQLPSSGEVLATVHVPGNQLAGCGSVGGIPSRYSEDTVPVSGRRASHERCVVGVRERPG